MKTRLILLATLLSITLAHADLIDLTPPSGFSYQNPFSKDVGHFFNQYQFGLMNLAGANIINGQVIWSPFTRFGADHFGISLQGDFAMVDWNLNGTGFTSWFVLVEDADFHAHLYRSQFFNQFAGDGEVSFDGFIPQGIIFAGYRGRVPDSGSTIVLMGIGLIGIVWLRRRFLRIL